MKKKMIKLTELNPGQKLIVKKIKVDKSIRRRLMDIGMVEGTIVECALKSPFNDPIAYFIRGALIAIRQEDTDKVYGILEEDNYEEKILETSK